jgi:hypothetical protein
MLLRKTPSYTFAFIIANLCFVPLATASGSHAYKYEIAGSYLKSDSDTIDGNALFGSLEYYFQAVNVRDHPLREAAFLEKTGSINLSYSISENKIKNSDYESREKSPSIGATYITDNSGFIISASYSKSDYDATPDEVANNSESRSIEIALGKYLTDSTTIRIHYRNTDYRQKYSDSTLDEHTLSYAISFKTVQPFGTTFYGIESVIDQDNGNSANGDSLKFAISGYYFLSRATSVDLSYSMTSRDNDADFKTYGISVEHFFTPMFAIGTGYERSSLDNSSLDADCIVANMTARF